MVVVGAESTGKTTLAMALADLYGAPLVEEFSREYLATIGTAYEQIDLVHIARGQWRREQSARVASRGLLLVDTDLLVIRIWSEVKYGVVPAFVRAQIQQLQRDHSLRCYVLTQPDIPWAADPLRENPDDRAELHIRYRQTLDDLSLPYIEVGGTHSARLQAVRAAIDTWRPELTRA